VTAETWRSRIVREADVDPTTLQPNPRNWRLHPDSQRGALDAVLGEVGWVQRLIVNERTGHVVDGHARLELAVERGEPSVPVIYVDLDEAEEALVLASLDPLAAMAEMDGERLGALLDEAQASDARLQAMLDDLRPFDRGPGGFPDLPDAPGWRTMSFNLTDAQHALVTRALQCAQTGEVDGNRNAAALRVIAEAFLADVG
jgi:hypothetical protein